jgi:hypothetical protein
MDTLLYLQARPELAYVPGEITPLPNNLSAMQRAFERAGLRLRSTARGRLPV